MSDGAKAGKATGTGTYCVVHQLGTSHDREHYNNLCISKFQVVQDDLERQSHGQFQGLICCYNYVATGAFGIPRGEFPTSKNVQSGVGAGWMQKYLKPVSALNSKGGQCVRSVNLARVVSELAFGLGTFQVVRVEEIRHGQSRPPSDPGMQSSLPSICI